MSEINESGVFVLRGQIIDEATYKTPEISCYQGNPLIEALPDILSPKQASRLIANFPPHNTDECYLEPYKRMHCVQQLSRFVFPLPIHIETEQKLSRIIRDGYFARNPLTSDYAQMIRKCRTIDLDQEINDIPLMSQGARSTTSGLDIIGISGTGKTTAVEQILLTYPQLILHRNYNGKNLTGWQVVWLKVDCPHDASIKGLCLIIFKAFDSVLNTNYYKKFAAVRKTVDELVPLISQIAATHHLGVLVVDEIQNLSHAKSGGSKNMLSFFVQLINTVGVPVILVGTPKVLPYLGKEFRAARRGTSQGDVFWRRLDFNMDWDLLIKGLWRYQWLKKPSDLTEEISKTLYWESVGIADIAVKLFMLAQWRTISNGKELITAKLIRDMARESLHLVRPMLDALRSGAREDGYDFEDLVIPHSYIDQIRNDSLQQIDLNSITYEPDITKELEIANWLVQSGITRDKAEIIISNLLAETPNASETEIKRKAFLIANNVTIDTPNKAKNKINKGQKKFTTKSGILLSLFDKAKDKGVHPYDTFKEKVYIKHSEEFLSY